MKTPDGKKPSLAVVIEETRKGKTDDEAPANESGENEDYSTSLAELADVLDVPDDKRDAFSDAMRAVVMACSK